MFKNSFFYWLPSFALIMFAMFLQSNLLLHSDVIYLMHASQLLLAGGSYAKDFFETNPPLILYLYAPIIFFAKISGINKLYIFQFYVLSILLVSIACCVYLSNKLFRQKYFSLLVLYLLIYSLFFAYVHEFGQREHLLLPFILPYVFLCALRLENIKIPTTVTLLIGLFAGIGFSLKPFFLVPLIFIESYLVWDKRGLRILYRAEIFALLCVMISYLAIVLMFHMDYIKIVLPFVYRLYFPGVQKSWLELLNNLHLFFCFLTMVFYFSLYRFCHYQKLYRILALAVIGLIIAYFIPRTNWFYSILPAFFVAHILLGILVADYLLLQKLTSYAEKMVTFLIVCVMYFISIYGVAYCFLTWIKIYHAPYTQRYIAFFKERAPNNSYYYLSQRLDYIIASLYGNANYTGRYPTFWWDNELMRIKHTSSSAALQKQAAIDEKFLIQNVINDLENKKPKYLLWDSSCIYASIVINYVQQFSKYPSFRKILQHYHFVQNLGPLRVYERDEK